METFHSLCGWGGHKRQLAGNPGWNKDLHPRWRRSHCGWATGTCHKTTTFADNPYTTCRVPQDLLLLSTACVNYVSKLLNRRKRHEGKRQDYIHFVSALYFAYNFFSQLLILMYVVLVLYICAVLQYYLIIAILLNLKKCRCTFSHTYFFDQLENIY